MIRIILLICMMAMASSQAFAEVRDGILSSCAITPSASPSMSYPGASKLGTSNNLRRNAGSSITAEGSILYVYGTVMDQDCVPVQGAVVEMWQLDSNGKKNSDPYFAGSGRTITDNMGRYNFVTVYPGASGKNMPKLNFNVRHESLGDITTAAELSQLDFTGKRLSARAEAIDSSNPEAGEIAFFDITLKGNQKYRGF